jgi:adenylyltransferase/sulfurtransferase
MSMSERYSRQERFTPMGEAGQKTLGEAHAVVCGCGALGTVAAELLARAGVGNLTIVDRDYVELSNLQRQLLFTEEDARESLPKAIAAERHLRAVNSEIRIHGVVDDLRSRNAEELLAPAGVVLDATDNFETRYLMNDFCVERGTPWIYAAGVGSYGITMPILPDRTACFRCIYPAPPSGSQPTCETAGVLGPLTAAVASIAAGFALQILSGNQSDVRRVITTLDLWHGPVREVRQPNRDQNCPCCGKRNFEWLAGRRDEPVSLCGRNAVQIHARERAVNLDELKDRLSALGPVRANEFALKFLNDPYELTVFPDGRAIIKGTTDPGLARSLYARWVG